MTAREMTPERAHKLARRWMWALGLAPLSAAVVLTEGLGGPGWVVVLLITVVCAAGFGVYYGWARGYEDARRD